MQNQDKAGKTRLKYRPGAYQHQPEPIQELQGYYVPPNQMAYGGMMPTDSQQFIGQEGYQQFYPEDHQQYQGQQNFQGHFGAYMSPMIPDFVSYHPQQTPVYNQSHNMGNGGMEYYGMRKFEGEGYPRQPEPEQQVKVDTIILGKSKK